ncbi:MAG: amino acid permease [Phycisphaerae bacterium]|nr:amino acid permease [Phycisphaerae bacterium]
MATTEHSTQVSSEGHAPHGELSRELSLFQITMMGLGMMIGAGVFLGMGISISKAGPGGVVLTFAFNGLLAVFTAMSFAELSSAIPRAGGAYNFARIGFGRRASFLAGWMEWFASSVAGSMYAMTFSIYTILFIKSVILGVEQADTSSITLAERGLAVVTALLFIYINYRGASETGKIGAIITVGQTIFVVAIGLVGVFTALRHPERLTNFSPFMPHGWSRLLMTMGFTYVAFEGYEVIAQAGDEAKDPRRNLPKAMLYSVLIVTVIYVLVAFAVVVSVDSRDPVLNGMRPDTWIGQAQEKGFARAVDKLMPFGHLILTLAVIFSSTSALNATVYSATRASYALGRDRMLPAWFARIHPVRKTPYGALICTGVIVLSVVTLLPVTDVASSASIMFLMLFFMVNLCVIKIRRCMADELQYGFLMPLFPLFPILAIIFQILLAVWLIHMSWIAWIVAPLWIGTGFMVYQVYGKSHATITDDEIQVLDEQRHPQTDRDKIAIMVAVANPASAEDLVKSTIRLCRAKDASVELIHMVSVPDQLALTDGRALDLGKEAISTVMRDLSEHFPINTTLRYCRNAARGIVAAAREKKCRMLVMGWHGRCRHSLFSIGSTVDPIIEQSPCDVVILKNCGADKTFKKVLVPLAGGPNGALALEIADILCETGSEGASITALNVDTGRHFDIDSFVSEQIKKKGLDRKHFKVQSITASDPIEGICQAAEAYDLLVLGTTQKSILSQFASRSIPEDIACCCDKPTVLVKANTPVKSFLKRWF